MLWEQYLKGRSTTLCAKNFAGCGTSITITIVNNGYQLHMQHSVSLVELFPVGRGRRQDSMALYTRTRVTHIYMVRIYTWYAHLKMRAHVLNSMVGMKSTNTSRCIAYINVSASF